ncbi:hypothetical protein [Methanohalophilus halophilus]|uniref:Uncharacterized protein n=1 Tax=Methanohalophilus halophilus TaxID=2177 RepID=A0A1L3Q015_9EURY|nr:hypothetical protein [Methanohalophilus halophilus]APH38216.1 hypothetical protein BHR79_01100 [Methanohalophilus halophilus]RNI10917.1 hypothetical protein EFE40_01690 [Methanohalophilus halophilus]SDV99646.1 hypothetical protein SAMN04515625_0040 [Methanohalophilus halophilus]
MSTDTTLQNPFSEPSKHTLRVIIDNIQKVIKTPPIKPDDTWTYHIHIEGKVLILTGAQLSKGPGRFKTLYLDNFGKYLHIQKTDDWYKFVEYIWGIAEEGRLEETSAVIAADLIFEQICVDFDVTDDKTRLLEGEACYCLVLHKPNDQLYMVVPSAAVIELSKECGARAPIEEVSAAMRARGYKTANTALVKANGTPVRCWWLLPKAIEEYGVDLSNFEVEL